MRLAFLAVTKFSILCYVTLKLLCTELNSIENIEYIIY